MRKVYLPFSSATRCTLTDWHDIPSFHACAFAPPFDDDARLDLFEPGEIDRIKGRMIMTLKGLVAAAALGARAAAALAGSRAARPAA